MPGQPGLKGVGRRGAITSGMQRTAFRSSWTQPEGVVAAIISEAVIIDSNLQNWTVDCISKFDQKRWLDIQVSHPYVHPNRGDGIYMMPEIGAKCYVCIPSDGPPPFVLSFIMPMEKLTDVGTEEAPEGTLSRAAPANFPTDATYAGGRTRPKPGDIVMRGRDGNFAILHRGGVLQIGSTQLAQRLYIPVSNLVTDITQNYHHYNTGGAIHWTVASGPSEEEPPTSYKHTFRLFAQEEKATIRVAMGTFSDIMGEKSGDDGYQSHLNQLDIGDSEPVIVEIGVSSEQFNADDGSLTADSAKESVFRFMLDKNGGTLLRSEGSILLATKGKLRIVAEDNIEFETKKEIILSAPDGGVRITAGPLLELNGGVTKLNGGSKPVASVGSQIQVVIGPPLLIQTSAGPGTILAGQVITGQVISGNPTILV